MDEEWTPIPEFDGYEINRNCEVRSFRGGKKGAAVRPRKSFGYLRYGLMKDGRQRWRMAHRLMWEAYVGPIPDGLQINHINGVKEDNRLENLEVATQSENVRHNFRVLGVKPNLVIRHGITNGNAKLTDELVREMIEVRETTGLSYQKLALRFGVAASTIHRVCTGMYWGHVKRPQ